MTGFTVDEALPGDLSAALVGWTVLYWWPRRQLAARHLRPPLPARRLLARGDLHPGDVGAAWHGGHATPRRLLWLALGASLTGHGGAGGRVARALRPRPPPDPTGPND